MSEPEITPISSAEADTLIDEAEAVLPCLQLPLADAKRLRSKLCDLGIPSSLGRDDHCKSGCSPKVLLLARQDDLPRIAGVLKQDWVGLLAQESEIAPQARAWFESQAAPLGPLIEAQDPPCPACGHVGPLLEDQSCADCGLVLA